MPLIHVPNKGSQAKVYGHTALASLSALITLPDFERKARYVDLRALLGVSHNHFVITAIDATACATRTTTTRTAATAMACAAAAARLEEAGDAPHHLWLWLPFLLRRLLGLLGHARSRLASAERSYLGRGLQKLSTCEINRRGGRLVRTVHVEYSICTRREWQMSSGPICTVTEPSMSSYLVAGCFLKGPWANWLISFLNA